MFASVGNWNSIWAQVPNPLALKDPL
jgi:hypothetical protein